MNSIGRQIFGNESARLDTYLYKCGVPFSNFVQNQPILSGRWGVGKTAAFLLRHRKLAHALRAVDRRYEYIWYLDEGGLDSSTLFFLDQHYGANKTALKRTLEKLWETEILRITARILSILHEFYGAPKGMHWNIVRSADYVDRYARPVWSSVADVIGASGDMGKAVRTAIGGILSAFSERFEEAVQACLEDIQHLGVTPAVVIEPVETPISIFEKENINLSQMILVSLLDLYSRKFSFSPERRQFIRVEISVPWHRDVDHHLREPQKLRQYIGHISWEGPLLRQFMVKRIDNEFRLVKRQTRQRPDTDAWDILFADTVRNNWSSCDENSFSYLLRHTHHRTRDIMRLARTAIHTQVDLSSSDYPNINAEHILAGSSVTAVSPTAIRAGVEEALKSTSEERLTEAARRYPKISDMIDTLRGIESPFPKAKLAFRVRNLPGTPESVIEALWECGIIGFEVQPNPDSTENVQMIEKNIGEKGISEFRSKHGMKLKRYFLFEYNSESSPTHIERTHNSLVSELNMVVHPVFIENLAVRATRQYPIGV